MVDVVAPRTPKALVTHHPWGALIWNHAPCNHTGWAGNCVHCGKPAMLRHPLTNKPCHKCCQDLVDSADVA